ncbi:transferase [Streptomyces hainanensis]|uniref:Transferase n=1 Tax=Streptomyces hainanensis TaxID=402648 RepID=A0A4R4TL22_9ACTN|nr:transferase [Streptomyces hainanensis]TDC78430.1 transferase [Streptomyces hainanensis]
MSETLTDVVTETPRADCRAAADGALTVELALPVSAVAPELRLLPRPKSKGEEPDEAAVRPLRLAAAGPAGRWRAVLAPEPALGEGRWDVQLRAAPDGEWRRVAPGVRDTRALIGREPDALADGLAVRVPYRTRDGWFAVRAWLRPAHAEAGPITVEPAEGTMSVRGRLFGAEPAAGAVGQLKLRGGGRRGPRHAVELRDEGGGAFSFTMSLHDLVAEAPAAEAAAVWDVSVRPAPRATRVKVARLLDDVTDKKAVFAFPACEVAGATVRPYYTVDNDLAVRVERPAS